MKSSKTLRYFSVLLPMLAFAAVCTVLQGFVRGQSENAASSPPPLEAGEKYNSCGLPDNAALSDKIIAQGGSWVAFEDRIICLNVSAPESVGYAAEKAEDLLKAVPSIERFCIMPIPERAVFETGFEDSRERYCTFVEELGSAVGDGVTVIDPLPGLDAHSDEFIYYRTENSWTMRGAFYGAQAFRSALGYAPDDLNAYRTYMLGSFFGDAYSAAMSDGIAETADAALQSIEPDPFYIYLIGTNPNREELTFKNKAGEEQTERRRTIQLNGYGPSAVIGGTYRHSAIDGSGEGSLLFLTDSAGDMLISYLSEMYEKIYAVSISSDKDFPQNIGSICETYGIRTVLWAQAQTRLGDRSYMRALNGLDGAP